MAIQLLPLLLLAGGAVAITSGKRSNKSRGISASPKRSEDCSGIKLFHDRASKGKGTIYDQAQKLVYSFIKPIAERPKVIPPKGMGLLRNDEADQVIYAVARAAYQASNCKEPPLPGKGTIEQRALFELLHYIAVSKLAIHYMGASWLPVDYIYRGMPTLTKNETEDLLGKLSKAAPFLATESQNFELFNKQWLTKLEQRILRARADFYSYNKGGSLRSANLQVPSITERDRKATPPRAEDFNFHEAQWMIFKETGKFAHPSTYDLVRQVGDIGNWAWWRIAYPNQPYISIYCNDGLPCYVRANSKSGEGAILLAKMLNEESVRINGEPAYGGDLEALAAAGILMATSEAWPMEPEKIASSWASASVQPGGISEELMLILDIDNVPPLEAILRSSSMSEQRSFATSDLFNREPILARLWSITVDRLISELDEEMSFG